MPARRQRGAGWARAWLGAALVGALLLPGAARADVIFRVPEVLVRHAAASRPVGTGHSNSTRSNDSAQWHSEFGLLELKYEEYFVEHDISAVDAKRAAAALNLDNVPATRVGCGMCSRWELQYCESRVLADHCCCEKRSFPEPFPWLPHTCYMGPGRCRPILRDCAQYARLRDCCCYRKLAERWKAIMSKSAPVSGSGVFMLLLILTIQMLLVSCVRPQTAA